MVIGSQILQIEEWSKQAFARLKKDALPPTPNNYAVYYYYFAGTNPTLHGAIDAILKDHGALTHEQCTELFERHLSAESEQKILRATNDIIEKEVSRVLDMIDRAAAGTNNYHQTLDNFSGELDAPLTLEQIREAVGKVVVETRAVTMQNEKLATQLSETTQQLSEVRQNLDQVHKESQIDALTEVGNRKFFERELLHSTSEARDNNWPLSLLIIDIDHFKKFNDTYGHIVGDQVLRLVARTLVENLKGRDVIARYGGEEFVILLPQTSADVAEKLANQLRTCLGTKSLKRRKTNESLGNITISIGATEYYVGEAMDDFIARADSAMYKAKEAGRNRVMIEKLSAQEIFDLQARQKIV